MEIELTPRVCELYDEIQKTITGRFPMWPQDAAALYEYSKGAEKYLEIGTAFGGSAILAAYAQIDNGSNLPAVYCIDPLDGFYGKGRPDILALGLVPSPDMVRDNFTKMRLIDGLAPALILKKTPPVPAELAGEKFDFILIDGNHTGTGPIDDWKCIQEYVAPNGFVMFHDLHKEAVNYAWGMANKDKRYKVIREYRNNGHGAITQLKIEGNEAFGSHGIVQRID